MTNSKRILVGTSGFSYKDWLGNFYPQFCVPADFLKLYSTVFKTVEIDSTYYRIPSTESVRRWKRNTPDDFVFSAKFPSSVTHEGEIQSRIDNALKFIDIMSGLDHKLGPLLMQFPYRFQPENNLATMEALIAKIPEQVRVVIEVRNRKWLDDRFFDILRGKKIALALVDHPWMPRHKIITSDFAYVRFLGDRKKIDSDFSYIRYDREEDLKWWAELVENFSRERGEVYAYLNNHYSGHSPTTALRLMEILKIKS